MHGTFVGLIINDLGSQIPLLFLFQTIQDVIWADLHNTEFVMEALLLSLLKSAQLILSNFFVATAWHKTRDQCHILRLLHVAFAETTILVTEGLSLSVWVPVIMGLIMSVVLVERVIQVTVNPRKLGHMTKEIWHL